ncbi:MAG: DUF2252 family protein [Kiloniellales bacterium]|nr:DUF2252 family protein [Kiloniellales bacterium]
MSLRHGTALAEEGASSQEIGDTAAAEALSKSLVISLSDYDFSQNPELLERILSSAHGYFRFIGQRFAQAVCRRFAADLYVLAQVNLHGDAHLENYSVTDRQRGLADFDDATAGPFVLDLVRFGVSLRLASRAMGAGDRADGLVAAFLEGYRSGLRSGDAVPPEPALAARIRAEFPNGRRAMLAKAQAMLRPIETSRRDFEQAMQQYVTEMRAEHPDLPPGFFEIKDLGTFKLGIGSALSEKYLMRAEGATKDPDDDLLIEAKAVRDLKDIDCVQRPRVEVGRIAIAQARLAFEAPRYVGSVTMHPKLGFKRRQKFLVFAWDDNYTELSVPGSFETLQDLFDVARDVGIQLGRGHPKSIADPYEAALRRALLEEVSNLEADIRASIAAMTRWTIAAWKRVRDRAAAPGRAKATAPAATAD